MVAVIFLWVVQVLVFAFFDSRKGTVNLALNAVAYLVSAFVTFKWGGVVWLLVPLVVMPLLGGVVGGVMGGAKRNSQDS